MNSITVFGVWQLKSENAFDQDQLDALWWLILMSWRFLLWFKFDFVVVIPSVIFARDVVFLGNGLSVLYQDHFCNELISFIADFGELLEQSYCLIAIE